MHWGYSIVEMHRRLFYYCDNIGKLESWNSEMFIGRKLISMNKNSKPLKNPFYQLIQEPFYFLRSW